ncbi:MAG: hypothetical protein GY850_38265, partial [bacterium]|nr:hypothetical protein [bacterium]
MKNLAKCILVLTILCGFAVPVAPVQADEAVRVYLELTADSTTLWPTLHWPAEEKKDYLRGRAVFLDGNGDLADSFNGKDISAAELLLESANYGSLVRFADKPATTTALVSGDWEPAASVVSLALNGGWHEFAVSYDEITQSGTDVLFATLR